MNNIVYRIPTLEEKKFLKPIRNKKEIILVLLNCVKIFLSTDLIANNDKFSNQIYLIVNKMSRVFIKFSDKIFSFNFPFFFKVEKSEVLIEDNIYNIDSEICSFLIYIFNSDIDNCSDLFDKITNEDIPRDKLAVLSHFIYKLLTTEFGYVRFDHDQSRQKGRHHPLNHLDVFYQENNQWKIEMQSKIEIKQLIEILDLTKQCWRIKK